MRNVERLIADPGVPNRTKQETFMALGLRACRGERLALKAIKNILSSVPSEQIARLLKDASVRAFAAKTLGEIQPIIRVLGNLCIDRRVPEGIKTAAFGILIDLIRKQGNQIADRELEKILPRVKNLICDPDISDSKKEGAVGGLKQAVWVNLENALQVAERLMPAWERFIVAPHVSDTLRYDAMMVLGGLFCKNIPSAVRAFDKIIPVLDKLIVDRRTSYAVRYMALTLLEVAALGKNRSACQAVEKLVPLLEDAIVTRQASGDRENLFGMFLGCVAPEGIEGVLGSIKRIIADPRVSDELKIRLLFYLGETISPGDGMLPELFKIRNAALSSQTAEGIIGMVEDLLFGDFASAGLQIEALRVQLYLIQRDFCPSPRSAGRLALFLEKRAFDPSVPDDLRRLAIRVSGWAASKGIPEAMPLMDRLLSFLEKAGGDTLFTGALKKEAMDALGMGLPLAIKGPAVPLRQNDYPEVSLQEILARVESPRNPRFVARSLIYDVGEDDVLAIKLLRTHENPPALLREAFWIKQVENLKGRGHFKGVRFDLPRVQEFFGSDVIKLRNIAKRVPGGLHPEHYALCFVVHRDYYSYPNGILPEKILSGEEFREVISRCAYLLGSLAACGVIHTDVIPLFHTVLTSHSREDRGMHMWWYKGAVHQWIQSCDYPNIGPTGLRDFEHLLSWGTDPVPFRYQRRPQLYYLIGSHLLSLFLLVGSYVRNKERAKVGIDRQGNTIDVRYLFDRVFLKEILEALFSQYYRAFVGEPYNDDNSLGLDASVLETAEEMIEEMGVDKFTAVGLLIRDQNKMTHAACKNLLRESGYSRKELSGFKKGKRNMLIFHGPNLFALPDSPAKMYTTIAAMASLCVVKRYKKESAS